MNSRKIGWIVILMKTKGEDKKIVKDELCAFEYSQERLSKLEKANLIKSGGYDMGSGEH